MPERVCKEAIEYPPGHYRKPGDRFDVDECDIPTLLAVGRIEPEEEVIDEPTDQPGIEGTLRVKRKYTKRQAA